MSWVTGVTLHTRHEPREVIESINIWLSSRGFDELKEISKMAGGTKHPQAKIFVCGYNYFHDKEFIDLIKNAKWDYPEHVVLILNTEDGEAAIVVRPNGVA